MPTATPEPLIALIDKVELSLEGVLRGRERDWTREAIASLRELEAALPVHAARIAPDMAQPSPTAVHAWQHAARLSPRRVDKLRQEHSDFVWWAKSLCKSLCVLEWRLPDTAGPGAPLEMGQTPAHVQARLRDLRHRGRYLIARLKKHLDDESDLVLARCVIGVAWTDGEAKAARPAPWHETCNTVRGSRN